MPQLNHILAPRENTEFIYLNLFILVLHPAVQSLAASAESWTKSEAETGKMLDVEEPIEIN